MLHICSHGELDVFGASGNRAQSISSGTPEVRTLWSVVPAGLHIAEGTLPSTPQVPVWYCHP